MTDAFRWEREVPAAWQTDLHRLNPGENVSKLWLHWLAGFPYDPVQRWVVYEVLPCNAIGDILEAERKADITQSLVRGLWEDLNGPDPRTNGKWVADRTVDGGKRWISKSLVSRSQWDVHKLTGGFPLLCWIIEGNKGGHAWQFGPFEQQFLLALNIDPQIVAAMTQAWPNPGSLPYAEYDTRVFRALAERDLLAKWRRGLSWEDRAKRTDAGLILTGESADRRKDMLDRSLRWLDNQISDAVSDVPRTLLPQWSDFTAAADPYKDDEHLHSLVTED